MDNNQQNDNRPNGPGGAGQGPNRNRSAFMVFLAITVAVLLGMALFNGLMGSSGSEEISYDKFLEWLDNGYIKSVTVNGSNLEVELKGDALRSAIGQRTVTYYTGNMNDPLLVQRLEKAGVTYKREVSSGITDLLLNVVLTFVLPMVLLWIVFGLLMRKMGGGGGGIMGVGKNKAKVYVQKETGITFKDVAGQDEAKESLQEVVSCRRVRCSWDLRVPVRRCWQRQLQARQSARSSLFPDQILWRCSSVSEHRVCVTCLRRRRKMRRASSLSMRLMRSERAVTAATAEVMMSVSRR